jgi:hypothetical protein
VVGFQQVVQESFKEEGLVLLIKKIQSSKYLFLKAG